MKGYCFIDMHIHSMFSNEEGVCQTPEKILDKTLDLIEQYKAKAQPAVVELLSKEDSLKEIAKFFFLDNNDEIEFVRNVLNSKSSNEEKAGEILNKFSKACISIADHNSILGSVEAVRIIKSNPEKYKNIDFIPGIEFNAGLKNLRINDKGKSVYSKCHLLGYGYDIENEDLKIFSKLFQLTIGRNNINIGHAICAARNAFKDEFGIAIPFSSFKTLLQEALPLERKKGINAEKAYASIRSNFLKVCEKYIPKKNQGQALAAFDNKIKNTVFPVVCQERKDNIGLGKLSIVETIALVKNAGGKTSIAHPAIILREKKGYTDSKNIYDIVSDIVGRIQDKTNQGLDALEILHQNNAAVLETLFRIAKQNNLYITAGSDSHNHDGIIGNLNWKLKGYISECFYDLYTEISKKDYGLEYNREKAFNRVAYLPIVEAIKQDKEVKNKQDCKICDGQMQTYSWPRVFSISDRVYAHQHKQHGKIESHKEGKSNKEKAFEEELCNTPTSFEVVGFEDTKPSNLWRTVKTWKDELIDLKISLEEQERAEESSKAQNQKKSNNTEFAD